MRQLAPEFSRPLEVSRLPQAGSHEKLEATADERVKLAKRLGLPALHGLKAELQVRQWRGGGVKVTGELHADAEQVSVISLESFRQPLVYPIERYFLPAPPEQSDSEDDAIDPIVDGQIDLGELVAETLALELDPYPRKPGEEFAPAGDDEAVKGSGAFAALKDINVSNKKRK